MMSERAPEHAPFVSVVMPVLNEAAFIDKAIRSVLAQEYPSDRFEVIVADGMSSDGTREILAELQSRHPQIVVLDNPQRIQATALNLAVQRARGDVLVRIDGHAEIAGNFLAQNVALLAEHPEAWSVGGPVRHVAKTTFGSAVALAMSHPLGVGNARHRYSEYEGYVESAAFPAFRRWVFDRIGGFDERLARNEDDEFAYRIHQAGGLVYVSPRVRYEYYVRSRVTHLFRQYFQYGFWRIPVIEKHRRPTTLRQLAPTLFHGAVILAALGGAVFGRPVAGAILPAAYLGALLMAGAALVPRAGVRVATCVPVAIATMHAGYGWGLAYGMWSRVFRRDAWNARGKMAAVTR